MVEWNRSRDNNIVMKTAADNGRGFMKDSHDPNTSRRYKMFGQVAPFCLRSAATGECTHGSPALNASTDPASEPLAIALGTSVSADGIRWAPNTSIARQVNAAADSSNQVLWDEQTRRYYGLTRIDLFSPTSGQYREAAITTSRDFRQWSRAVETLHNNISERSGAHPRQENTYVVFRPEGNAKVWLSLVTFAEGPKVSWGRFVTELAWSADLHTWHRVCPGTPFIDFGGPGSWDEFMTVAAAAPLPDVAEPTRTRVYYVGMNGPWKSSRGE